MTQQRNQPARQVCPLCGLDDDDLVRWAPEAPGLWRFTCANHSQPYAWLTTASFRIDEKSTGSYAEGLGVYNALLGLFAEPGPFREWGVVEHQFALVEPAIYRELVGRYSHVALGPTQYSASAFLAQAAGKLAREGHLAIRWVQATGFWAYNTTISSFTLAPAAEDAAVLTWAAFAQQQGFGPGDWPALDYVAGGQRASGRLLSIEPWAPDLAERWFTPDQVSYRGWCGWNHRREDEVPATRHVVVEDDRGVQLHYAVCEDCIESVERYTGDRS